MSGYLQKVVFSFLTRGYHRNSKVLCFESALLFLFLLLLFVQVLVVFVFLVAVVVGLFDVWELFGFCLAKPAFATWFRLGHILKPSPKKHNQIPNVLSCEPMEIPNQTLIGSAVPLPVVRWKTKRPCASRMANKLLKFSSNTKHLEFGHQKT